MITTKKTVLFLVALLILSLLAGCTPGPATSTAGMTTKPAGGTTTPQSTNTTTARPGETEAGSELSDFVSAYMEAKTDIWDQLSKKLEEGNDMTAVFSLLGFAMADLSVAIVPFFDVVSEAGGTLFLTGIKNAHKTVNGQIIDFGYDFVYDTDSGQYQKDDRVVCTGQYDMAKGALRVEMSDQKNKLVTSRTVIEIVRLADDAYASQFVSYNGEDNPVQGYFTLFRGTDLWSVMAEQESSGQFKHNSIYNLAQPDMNDMIKGFTVKTEASLVDGKATFSQK
jgi:hypothetical protein